MLCSFQHLQTLTLCLIILLPFAKSVSFKKTRFVPTDTSIIYEGAAMPSVGAIEFNSDNYMCQVGRATYAEKVPLWNSKTKTLTDFTSHFSFLIDIQGRTSYAADWDPPVQHVGINNNSVSSASYTAWNVSLHNRDPADVWIKYNATTKNLSVSWKYQNTSSPHENSSLSYIIDLREVLPEWVRIGFTAATSNVIERHVLQSWEFHSDLKMNEEHRNNAKRISLIAILPISIALLLAAIVIGIGVFYRQKIMGAETAETVNLTSMNDDLERGAGPRKFSHNELVSATSNFSNDRKLGEGGFGAVYKGYLNDLDLPIAVKKISGGSRQGRREYVTEEKVISQLRHRNLVQLIGWCHDKGQFLLVYEFMPNGSLDSHLFGRKPPLAWTVRYRIALGLASALLYLHEEWERCVVHRDVKSSNVMLDSVFNVKLGDFGLARLMDHELGPLTTGFAGTIGYVAPECIITGKASKESDVYSFGIVALEIAAGRKAIGPIEQDSEKSLVEWIWNLYGTENFVLAADEKLRGNYDVQQLECLMIVGLWCAHPDRGLRPSIRQAIQVLNFEAPLPDLPTRMPVPFYQVPTPFVRSGTSASIISSSSNNFAEK